MKFIITTVLLSILLFLLLYGVSYFIEKVTNFKFLMWSLKREKGEFLARGAADISAIIFFIVNMIVLLVQLDLFNNKPEGYSFLVWLLIVLPLSILVRTIHLKLQNINPEIRESDYLDPKK